MTQTTMPTIKVERDYDGYFEGLVRNWVEKKAQAGNEFHHTTITVNSGPWRPYAVTTKRDGDTIHLDFYAALRAGFGDLSDREIERLMELL